MCKTRLQHPIDVELHLSCTPLPRSCHMNPIARIHQTRRKNRPIRITHTKGHLTAHQRHTKIILNRTHLRINQSIPKIPLTRTATRLRRLHPKLYRKIILYTPVELHPVVHPIKIQTIAKSTRSSTAQCHCRQALVLQTSRIGRSIPVD